MQTSLTSSATKYGLIIGLFLAFNFLFATANNIILFYFSNLFFLLTFFYVYRFTVQFREKERNGVISYGDAFLYVMLLFFFGGILYAGTIFIYCKIINPTFLVNLYNSKPTFEQINSNFTQLGYPKDFYKRMLTSPPAYALISIAGIAMIGVTTGVIMGFFIKKKEVTTGNN